LARFACAGLTFGSMSEPFSRADFTSGEEEPVAKAGFVRLWSLAELGEGDA